MPVWQLTRSVTLWSVLRTSAAGSATSGFDYAVPHQRIDIGCRYREGQAAAVTFRLFVTEFSLTPCGK